jgi:hypothetical protein
VVPVSLLRNAVSFEYWQQVRGYSDYVSDPLRLILYERVLMAHSIDLLISETFICHILAVQLIYRL